mmetsp:Transcript_76491/g.238228  ORF Transcript_76491/g.238228 Transcript_76491/m.238228 type:complete len:475 (+) Transcript_76491:94-1518(+)
MCVEICQALKFLLILALVCFVLSLVLIGLLVGFLLESVGLRTVMELLLVAIMVAVAAKVIQPGRRSGDTSVCSSPVARYLVHRAAFFSCVARWGLQQLGLRLPSRLLAAASWVAACGFALGGRPDFAYVLITAGTVLTLAALCSPEPGSLPAGAGRGGPLREALLAPEHPIIPAASLWEYFFDACRATGAELFEREAGDGRRWLTRVELQELGPQTLVGLPAMVLLRTALRGAVAKDGRCPEGALLLCCGQVLTRASVPKAAAAQEAFGWMLEAQDALQAAGVRHSDLPVLDGLALWEGQLQGIDALAPGDDVESREDLAVRKAFFFSVPVPAGSHGVVQEVASDGDEVLVRWDCGGTGLAGAPKLLKMSGDRPKPKEAEPPPDADERMPKLRLAAGRARAVAMTVSAMPMFAEQFQRTVVDTLVQGTQLPRPPPELERTDTGGVVWQSANSVDSLALGLAVEIGRARSRLVRL